VIFGPIKFVFRVVGLLLVLSVLYFCVTFVQVWLTGREHTTKDAQAILVFGTAELNCRPSQELTDRLHHAFALYQDGRAPFIAVTGGSQKGDVCTEAGVSASYLEARGVPKTAILLGRGDDTWQNVATVLPALRRHHITTVITVTDPFHEDRAMATASSQGLTPYPSPVSNSAVRGPGLWRYYLKETLEVGVARVTGYHLLSQWLHV